MRTTLTLDDDVLRAAKSIARTEGKSLGAVISEWIRRALAPRPQEAAEDGFPVFDVPADATPITLEMVHRGNEDEA